MSTDVLTLSVKHAMRRRISPGASLPIPVCRNLFGPVDHNKTEEFLKEEIQRIHDSDTSRYNFDFIRGRPLSGRYQWRSENEMFTAIVPMQTQTGGSRTGVAATVTRISPRFEGISAEASVLSNVEGNEGIPQNVQCSRQTLRELNTQPTAFSEEITFDENRLSLPVARTAFALIEATRNLSVSAAAPAPLITEQTVAPIASTSKPQRQTIIPDFMGQRKRSASESKSIPNRMSTNGTPSKKPKTSP